MPRLVFDELSTTAWMGARFRKTISHMHERMRGGKEKNILVLL